MRTKINGQTKIFGFFGKTFQTSRVYALYNAAFSALNLNCVYLPFQVKNLKKGVEAIRHLGIAGVGVTTPFKEEILQFLDEVEQPVKKIKAVNAVRNEKGKLLGTNTDGLGAVAALKEKTSLFGKKIVLIGAGGAGRAIAFALKEEGVSLTIVNRSEIPGKILAQETKSPFFPFSELPKILSQADILINATSLGMGLYANQSPLRENHLSPPLLVMDIVSFPRETLLLKMAKKNGCQIIRGERMLLWQAVFKFKFFTGREAPIKIMEKALCCAF